MRIENIHVDGFGVWNDRTWGPLEPGLNVFHGPNETGKSHAHGIIRSMLFGFEKRGSAKRYEPVNGGSHGGWLDLVVTDTRLRLERKPGRHVRGTVALYAGDSASDESCSGKTSGRHDKDSLSQCVCLRPRGTRTVSHVAGHGDRDPYFGSRARHWRLAVGSRPKDLEERQSALFLPAVRTARSMLRFKELESVRDDLDRTEHQPQDYLSAHDARSRLAVELAVLKSGCGRQP